MADPQRAHAFDAAAGTPCSVSENRAMAERQCAPIVDAADGYRASYPSTAEVGEVQDLKALGDLQLPRGQPDRLPRKLTVKDDCIAAGGVADRLPQRPRPGIVGVEDHQRAGQGPPFEHFEPRPKAVSVGLLSQQVSPIQE